MQKSESISIVCVCDNHYALLLAALMKSIEQNHKTHEVLDFHLVEDGITDKNKQNISSLFGSNTKITWYPMPDCIPADAKLPTDKSSLPLNVYVRLFIPYFIPETVKKVIYLDVDMIMLEDISVLWHTDLGDNIVAAVQDQFIQIVSRWGGVINHEELGIPAENPYFNSGLMIMDLPKWKNADVTNQVFQCVNENKNEIAFHDQYGLNAVLAFHWYQLDPLWNRFAYSEEERPFLIHFTGRKPIYKSYEFSEKYKEIFFEYLAMTPWKNFKPLGETSRYWKKLNNFVSKFKNLLSPKK